MSLNDSFILVLLCLFILQLEIKKTIAPFNKKYFIYIIFSANSYKFLIINKIAQLHIQERNKQEHVSQVLLNLQFTTAAFLQMKTA